MSTITLIDERSRPMAPKIEGVTPRQQMQGKRLAFIHQMHIQELHRTRFLMEQIEAGEDTLATLADAIPRMQMVRAYQAFGSVCGQECRILTFHHGAEDDHIFPALRTKAGDGLMKVIDRLAEEHLVIHALIEQLQERATHALAAPGPDSFADLKGAFTALDTVLRSHFGYEETQLAEALGYFNIAI